MSAFYQVNEEDLSCFSTKNLTFPAHLHSPAELLFIMDGTLSVTVNEQTKTLTKNCAALIFPNMIHSYETEQGCDAFLCIFSSGSMIDYYHLFQEYQPADAFLASSQIHPDILPAFKKMLESKDADTSSMRCKAWLHLILTYLLPELELNARDNKEPSDVTYQVIYYISQHFQESFTLEKMANDLHFNKSYVSRVFSKKLKCGFYEYVNQIRLNHASHLIRISNMRLTDIWMDAGFESQRTFNRVFKEKYEMTPMEYRKQMK